VIEDDGRTAAGIVEDFTSAGFAVDREITGPGGLRRAQTDSFDVITLDRLLPEMDELTLLDRLRDSGVRTPVLVLSALSSVDERIRGLRAGGDDDLSKPFATAELRARVAVLARLRPTGNRPGYVATTSCSTSSVASRVAHFQSRHRCQWYSGSTLVH